MDGAISHARWPEYNNSAPENLVLDVNATMLCRTELDDFRKNAISFWIDLFVGDEYPK